MSKSKLRRVFIRKKFIEGIIMTLVSVFFFIVSFRLEMFALLWWLVAVFVMFVGAHGVLRLIAAGMHMVADHIHKKSLQSRCSKSWEEHLEDDFKCQREEIPCESCSKEKASK